MRPIRLMNTRCGLACRMMPIAGLPGSNNDRPVCWRKLCDDARDRRCARRDLPAALRGRDRTGWIRGLPAAAHRDRGRVRSTWCGGSSRNHRPAGKARSVGSSRFWWCFRMRTAGMPDARNGDAAARGHGRYAVRPIARVDTGSSRSRENSAMPPNVPRLHCVSGSAICRCSSSIVDRGALHGLLRWRMGRYR